jgi:hypothetical protein
MARWFYAEVELEVEDGLSLLLEELSLFFDSVLDSAFDSEAFAPFVLLESPFDPLRA